MSVIDPHAVKVYDLKGGVIGEEFSFSVDTSEAGKGELQCVITLSGRTVPSSIQSTGRDQYSVKFVPTGPGEHLIRPMFGGKDVRDEPYKVDIANSNLVAVQGLGLEQAKINHPAKFTVNVDKAGVGDVTAYMTDSAGMEVPCRTTQVSDKLYNVEYTPVVIGQHSLEVKFADKHVRDSPFTVNVYNDPKATVPEEGTVEQPVTIMLDTSDTGTGDLNIIVNGGTVPVDTQRLGKNKYSASFTPSEPGQYTVELEFNNTPVQGSPWYVNVTSAAGERSRSVTPPIPDYIPAPPPLIQRDTSSESSARTTPPPLHPIYSVVRKKPAETVEEVTTEVREATPSPEPPAPPVPVAPVVVPAPVVVQPPPAAVQPVAVPHAIQYARVGEKRSFDVSTNNIKVKIQDEFGSKVKFTETKNAKGKTVTYAFKHIGKHYIHMTNSHNRKPVTGSPFLVSVFDPSQVKVQEFKHEGVIGVPSNFRVDAKKAGEGEVTVQIDQGTVPYSIQPVNIVQPVYRGIYKVSYTSNTSGTRSIEVFFNKVPVPGSPFRCSYPSPITEVQPPPPVVAAPVPSPPVAATHIVPKPSVSAAYPVTAAPDYSSITATGSGLQIVEVGKTTSFIISHEGHRGQPTIRIEGPYSEARPDIQAIDDSSYKVSYIPMETGIYSVYMKWNGVDLTASPYRTRAVDPRKVKPEGDWAAHLDEDDKLRLQVSKVKRLLFDVSKAGPGGLEASGRVLSSGAPLQCTVTEKDQFHYWLDILAGEPGDAVIDLKWGGYTIPESPISAVVTEAVMNGHSQLPVKRQKVLLTGEGYKTASVDTEAVFYVDGSMTDGGSPTVLLKNSKLETVPVYIKQLRSQKEYRCAYTVEQFGTYMLYVSWNDQQLDESPFTVIAEPEGPESIEISGEGLNPGILSTFDGSFSVDTTRAGKGSCTVKIKGPRGDVKTDLQLDRDKPRVILGNYVPMEVGLYVVYVKWSGQDVRPPIKVYVFDTFEELEEFNKYGRLPAFMHPQDNISLQSYSSYIPRNAKSKSLPLRLNGDAGNRGPPIRKSVGPRNSHEGKLSYFVVAENEPALVSRRGNSKPLQIVQF